MELQFKKNRAVFRTLYNCFNYKNKVFILPAHITILLNTIGLNPQKCLKKSN